MLAPHPAPISSVGFSSAACAETISLWSVARQEAAALADTVAHFRRHAESVRTRGWGRETFWKKIYWRSYSEMSFRTLRLTTCWTGWGRISGSDSLRSVVRWKGCAVERKIRNRN